LSNQPARSIEKPLEKRSFKENMKNIVQKISSNIVFILALLTPVWFLPISADFFGTQKQFLFVATACILSALWIIQVIREKRVLFSISPVSLSALVLLGAVILSAVFAPNTAFQLSDRFLSFLAMTLILLFGFSTATHFQWDRLLKALTLGSTALAVIVWWQFVLPNAFTFSALLNRVFGTQFSTGVEFSLAESPAVLLALFVPVVFANGITLWKKLTHSELQSRQDQFSLAGTLFLFATLCAVIFSLVSNPDTRPVILPYQYGWGIAIENWKQLPRMLFGMGPEQFLAAFHRFRDVTYNISDFWALRFRASSSEALHSLTTVGVVGFIAWMSMYITGFFTGRKVFRQKPGLFIFFLIQAALFWIVPLSATTFILLTLTLLAIMEEARQKDPTSAQDVIILLSAIQLAPSGQLKSKKTHAAFAYATATVAGLGLVMLSVFAGRVYASQLLYWQSLLAAQQNDVTKTYELQQRAIELSPYNTQMRRAYSSTNLAIARALAQNPDITEEQRQIFAELLQQSIREARLAAQINPTETENWEHLATIYSNMLDVEGSPRWATAALIQAIQTDPLAPQLRVQLGNLYIVLEQPDQSLRYFEQAIQLKPDWYVAFFRYGVALQAMNQPGLATQAFERSLSLLQPEDQDFAVIQEQFSLAQSAANAQQGSAAEAESEANEDTSVFETEQPSIPQGDASSPADVPSFDQLIESDPIQEQNNTPENTGTSDQNTDGGIILPEDVGF